MELIMAIALLYCPTWPCKVLIVAAATGAAVGGATGYLAASSVIRQFASKTRV